MQRVVLLYFLVFGSVVWVKAQVDDFRMTPPDSAFVLEVSRLKNEVLITMRFKDASLYNYIIIEKTDDLKDEFRQCAYIDFSEDKVVNGTVQKKDKYPRSMYNSSYYRVIVVSKEGVSRTYSPVRLPALPKKQ